MEKRQRRNVLERYSMSEREQVGQLDKPVNEGEKERKGNGEREGSNAVKQNTQKASRDHLQTAPQDGWGHGRKLPRIL